MKNNSSEMKIFYYNKAENHKSSDTDRLIKESLNGYFRNDVSVEVKRTDAGKPYLYDCPLHVGVTHTDSIVIIAISENRFGIDCESINRVVKNLYRIAEKYYSDNERAYVFEKSGDKSEVQKRFLEIWVKKEAYVKYTGKGLSAISRCDVTELCTFKRIENDYDLIIYIYEENKNE